MVKERIVSDAKILGGKPVVAGTRISVELILELLSAGWSYEQIVKDYLIKEKDILAAIEYAKNVMQEVQIVPVASFYSKSDKQK